MGQGVVKLPRRVLLQSGHLCPVVDPVTAPPPNITLRTRRPGDVGWALMRQARIYSEEFHYSPVFERYVAHTATAFLDHFDPEKDNLWIAERDGQPVGCVALDHLEERPGWAKLRWYFVEKELRGAGVGRSLFDAALAFARDKGYQGVFPHTVSDLHDARRVYEKYGFKLVREETAPCPWAAWGREQDWELVLRDWPR